MMDVDDLRVLNDNQYIDEYEDDYESEGERDDYTYEDYCFDEYKAERDEEAWF